MFNTGVDRLSEKRRRLIRKIFPAYLFLVKPVLIFFIAGLFTSRIYAQSGCTDPQAQNYDPSAKTNNGNCTYPATSISLTNVQNLHSSLNENSGLIYTNGGLWTLNDSGSAAAIYKIDENNGNILKTVTISNATNVDWEALTADADYFYIGDFGNNTNGNRTNLKIYRVSKAAVENNTSVTADIISFSYSDQVIQNPVTTGPNQTEFDCEAFLVKDNQLHLFTKDWIGEARTKHYTLPAIPGTYNATLIEEFNVNGLITGASISTTNANEIVLIGYSSNLANLFMWVLFDYAGNNFFSGNKRRFELGSAGQGQIEGVTFSANRAGYISSERINRTVFGVPIEVPPHLYSFSVADYVPLPVELISFNASFTDPDVVLTWQTASEANSAFFIIEQSADARHFKEIGRHEAAGNSATILNYRFTDRKPASGTNYYRLKQVDFDGRFSYSSIKSVTTNWQNSVLKINPVPVLKGEPLRLMFRHKQAEVAIIILLGASGKVWLKKEVKSTGYLEEILDTHQLKPGMYILQILESARIHTAKVLIL